MAERSTARPADGAARYDDEAAAGLDSWISRRARLKAGDSDTYHERQEATAPQWREDVYGPTDAGPVHEDAYAAQQETRALPEVGYAPEEYPHPDYAGGSEYRHEEPDPQDPEADEDGWPLRTHKPEVAARPRPASRRRWLIAVGGLALGTLLCALAFMWGSGQPPEDGLPPSAPTPPDAFEEPTTRAEMPSTAPGSATPPNASATPSATPSVTPSATPSATPSVTHPATPPPTRPVATPTQAGSASPVLLGPSSNDGVANMAQRYCDRHTAGSTAQPRNDGRWQCTGLLFASTVDMDVACRDTYGSGAFARTSNSGDPYAWRCYR